MAQFMLTYIGSPKPSSPEEGKKHMEDYKEWLTSLGSAIVSPANPIKNSRTINSDGTVSSEGTTTMSGFTVIEADSEEEALEMAKGCPFLTMGGSLEVSELIKVSM